jgi:signal transduction histidine kinase
LIGFGRLPIKRKLTFIIMATTMAALALACAAFITYERVMFRRTMVQDMGTLAQIIGIHSTAALVFNDPQSAEETLAALTAERSVVSAFIYDSAGAVFAQYPRVSGEHETPPSTPSKEGHRFAADHLALDHWIVLDGERVGTVSIKADLQAMHSRLQLYAGIVALVVLLSSLAAFLLSSRLQQVISDPILHLEQTARAVSREQNYSVRATKQTEDELGALIDGFNGMLEQIQARDAALENAKAELEKRVIERTAELEQEIAERKRAEEAVAQHAKDLARSNAELEQFASVASHDLKEPLRMVASYTQLLARRYQGKLDADADDFIDHAVDGVNRMQRLINDLLAYARVGTNRPSFEPVRSGVVLERVLDHLRMAVEETGAVVTHDPLPAVIADEVELGQLFQNLIGNALKFHGPAAPRVHVSAEARGREWLFSVRDNGIGIQSEYTDRIFLIFQRLQGRNEYPGTGIGLAICKKIIERHGGRIWVESMPGEGSTFYFTLPNPVTPAKDST